MQKSESRKGWKEKDAILRGKRSRSIPCNRNHPHYDIDETERCKHEYPMQGMPFINISACLRTKEVLRRVGSERMAIEVDLKGFSNHQNPTFTRRDGWKEVVWKFAWTSDGQGRLTEFEWLGSAMRS